MTARMYWVVLAVCLVMVWIPGSSVPTDPANLLAWPSLSHWLGTDHLGRDVGLRLAGALGSFARPALLAAALSATGGTLVGIGAAWIGGPLGSLTRTMATAMLALPQLVTVLLVLMAFGAGSLVLGGAVGIVGAAHTGLRVADRITALKQAEFVLAARAHGLSDAHVLMHHVLRLACGDVLLRGAGEAVASVAVFDVTLAYLGHFGVAEPTPSLGNVLVGAIESGGGNPIALLAASLVFLVVAGPLGAHRRQDGLPT